MGDVILTTPVIARLRYIVGPNVAIHVETKHCQIFDGNPHVNQASESALENDYDLVINLDEAYEKRRNVHSVDAYMIEAFGDADWPDKRIVLRKRPLPQGISLEWQRSVTLHPANTDRNRTIPVAVWVELMKKLVAADLVPVVLGKYREIRIPDVAGAVNLTDKLNLQQTATAIQLSSCFVSADTGLTHVAGSTETPMVTIYTAVLPQHRMPWRYGILGWRVKSILPHLSCVGCISGPGCKRSDFACVEGELAPSAEDLFAAITGITSYES